MAEQRLEQGGLPGPVRPDEPDVLAAFEREAHAREEVLLPGGELQALDLEHGAAAPGRLQELEPERAALRSWNLDRIALDPLDLLQLRLRLAGLRPVAEAGNELLQAGDVVRLPLRGLRERSGSRRLLLAPDVPRTREEGRSPAVELEHRRCGRLEKPAVVGDQDHGGVDRLELTLEPLEALHVQMVRRLVEEQQVRIARERPRERGPGQLAARERGERPVVVLVDETEPAEDALDALTPRIAPGMLEPRLGL
jgi:hypothetical protein